MRTFDDLSHVLLIDDLFERHCSCQKLSKKITMKTSVHNEINARFLFTLGLYIWNTLYHLLLCKCFVNNSICLLLCFVSNLLECSGSGAGL